MAKAKGRRLGRGLGSLLSTPVEVDLQPDDTGLEGGSGVATGAIEGRPDLAGSERVARIPTGEIRPNPAQPRQDFDEAALESLGQSIQRAGLMQPLIVRRTAGGGYELVAGERRWRSAQKLGLETVPVIIRNIDDRQSAEWALIENLQREDLNSLERAEAFRHLADSYGLTHQEIAETVGIDRSSVSNHLRLLELDQESRDAIRGGRLSFGHAKLLLGLTNITSRQEMARQAIRQAWSVRELDRRIKRAGDSTGASGGGATGTSAAARLPVHMRDLERQLGEHLGTRVRIVPGRKRNSGKLVIEFYDLDQFDGVMQRLDFKQSL